jgi:hypothetical protein
MAAILQFSKNCRSWVVDCEIMEIRAKVVSYGHVNQISFYIDMQSAWNPPHSRNTHGIYGDHQE